ncbi:MAG: DUF1877 family protein [Nakamurella sp.]
MGIRWYGWAVTPEEAEIARTEPWTVIRLADERHDRSGWTNADLDKAWRYMQQLFADENEGCWARRRPAHGRGPRPAYGRALRPAYDLVAGDVTYPNGYEAGYLPHIGILQAERVREISHDLATISTSAIKSYFLGQGQPAEVDYVGEYMKQARDFTADAASRGHAVVYMIR